jgi:hypothetical protein
MVRKLCLVLVEKAFNGQENGAKTQLSLSIIVLGLALAMQIFFRPYLADSQDKMEVCSLLASIMVVIIKGISLALGFENPQDAAQGTSCVSHTLE